MKMVSVTNITDHEREVRVGIRHEGPWVKVGPGASIRVRHEVAYGWPADDEAGLPAMGGLLVQEDNWALTGKTGGDDAPSADEKPGDEKSDDAATTAAKGG